MNRRLPPILLFLLCASGAALAAPAQPAPDAPGPAKTPVRKIVAAPKPLAVEGAKGAENFCAAVAASAASTRLAWQEPRVKALQAELIVKTAELDVKAAEVRQWVPSASNCSPGRAKSHRHLRQDEAGSGVGASAGDGRRRPRRPCCETEARRRQRGHGRNGPGARRAAGRVLSAAQIDDPKPKGRNRDPSPFPTRSVRRLAVRRPRRAVSTSGRELFVEPPMSPVGSGFVASTDPALTELDPRRPIGRCDPFEDGTANLFTDPARDKGRRRHHRPIMINDKATFGNTSGRSQTAQETQGFDLDL